MSDNKIVKNIEKQRKLICSTTPVLLGRFAVTNYSKAMESILKNAFDETCECALISLGGFGRRELCLGSDIDFMILTAKHDKIKAYKINNLISDLLWKAGLEVGSTVRTIHDCVTESGDLTVKMSLLDSRFLSGNLNLYEKYQKKVLPFIITHKKKQFLEEIINEIYKRRFKYPDNFISEPELKDGVGTVRDYNTICWINKIIPIEKLLIDYGFKKNDIDETNTKIDAAADFIFRMRNVIQIITSGNCLRFEIRSDAAKHMGYGSSASASSDMMRQFFCHSLTIENNLRLLMQIIEDKKRSSKLNNFFYINSRYLEINSANEKRLSTVKSPIMTTFWFLITKNLQIGIRLSLFLIKQAKIKPESHNNASIRLFLKILSLKFPISDGLMAANKLGILSKFIPELENIRALIPNALFHKYSVDIHSIMAVRKIDNLLTKKGHARLFGTLSSIINQLNGTELAVMRLTALFHDIGKSEDTADHSTKGAIKFKLIMEKFGIEKQLILLGMSTIQNHLIMNKIIRKRDISDPKTIKEFIDIIRNKAALKWLLAITYADMSSVNDTLWNQWYEILADQLYTSTIETFEKKEWASLRSKENKSKLTKVHKEMPYLKNFSDRFFNDIEENNLKYIEIARKSGSCVKAENGFSKLFVWKKDRKGLLSDITGILLYKEINILGGTTYLINDDAVDMLIVKTLPKFLEKDLSIVAHLINSMETINIKNLIETKHTFGYAKTKIIKSIMPSVTFEIAASDLYTVIDIKASDVIGLLHNICKTLTHENCSIVFFKLSTVSDVASDSFYITGPNGGKIFDTKELEKIASALKIVL